MNRRSQDGSYGANLDYDNGEDDDGTRGRVRIDAHVRRNPPGREIIKPGPGNSRRRGTQLLNQRLMYGDLHKKKDKRKERRKKGDFA